MLSSWEPDTLYRSLLLPLLYAYCQLMTMFLDTMHFTTENIGDYENIFISSAALV